MKKIFTLLLVFAFTVSFAQMGNISLETKSGVSHSTKDAHDEFLMPGDWASATQVGTFRWVDADDNPLGWIFGNNTYGHQGVAMPFEVDEEMHIHGAYVWFGAAEPGDGDIHFRVMAFNGSIGDEIGSMSVALDDIDALVTGEDVTPDMYDEAMYVEFDSPIAVDGEFAFVVDYGDVEWSAHGDGVGMASTVGSGAGEAMVLDETSTWLMATDLNAALVMDLGIFPHVTPADDDPDDTYTLTLNVDMTDAVAEGDVEFDPEIHHVWVTGTFADWAMPGENADFQMHPADPAKSEDTFYENWDGFADFTTDLSPWTNIDEHGEPTWGASDFDFEGEAEAFGWRVMNPAETDPDITDTHPAYDGSKYVFSVASNPVPPTGEENKWLISPEIVVTADSELSFAAKSITDQYGNERFRVHVSTTGVDPSDFTQISDGDHIEVPTDWEMYSFDLGDYAGQSIHFAIENVSSDAFMLFIDAIEVTNLGEEENGEDPEEHIYTITFDATEGDHEYKYFLVEDDPSWDLGEWEGDPNRELYVDGDMEVHDVFGEEPVSILEPEVADIVMNIFPNPATTEINVETEEMIEQIRVYDITGREVMQVLVNGNNQTINVSTLREGFYIMQVHTENGVEGRRFHVTR